MINLQMLCVCVCVCVCVYKHTLQVVIFMVSCFLLFFLTSHEYSFMSLVYKN